MAKKERRVNQLLHYDTEYLLNRKIKLHLLLPGILSSAMSSAEFGMTYHEQADYKSRHTVKKQFVT